jgi:hypothetical protein
MESTPLRLREAVVDGVADERVPEPKPAGGLRRQQDVVIGELGQRR